jgi:hypothetical protein
MGWFEPLFNTPLPAPERQPDQAMGMPVQSTAKEMIPVRNAKYAHASDVVDNDQLLLPILKEFSRCTRS